MSDRRESDEDDRAWFRTERFFEHGGQWYFTTREGTTEGPFSDKLQAQKRLDAYIKVMNSGIFQDTEDPQGAVLAPDDWSLKPK